MISPQFDISQFIAGIYSIEKEYLLGNYRTAWSAAINIFENYAVENNKEDNTEFFNDINFITLKQYLFTNGSSLHKFSYTELDEYIDEFDCDVICFWIYRYLRLALMLAILTLQSKMTLLNILRRVKQISLATTSSTRHPLNLDFVLLIYIGEWFLINGETEESIVYLTKANCAVEPSRLKENHLIRLGLPWILFEKPSDMTSFESTAFSGIPRRSPAPMACSSDNLDSQTGQYIKCVITRYLYVAFELASQDPYNIKIPRGFAFGASWKLAAINLLKSICWTNKKDYYNIKKIVIQNEEFKCLFLLHLLKCIGLDKTKRIRTFLTEACIYLCDSCSESSMSYKYLIQRNIDEKKYESAAIYMERLIDLWHDQNYIGEDLAKLQLEYSKLCQFKLVSPKLNKAYNALSSIASDDNIMLKYHCAKLSAKMHKKGMKTAQEVILHWKAVIENVLHRLKTIVGHDVIPPLTSYGEDILTTTEVLYYRTAIIELSRLYISVYEWRSAMKYTSIATIDFSEEPKSHIMHAAVLMRSASNTPATIASLRTGLQYKMSPESEAEAICLLIVNLAVLSLWESIADLYIRLISICGGLRVCPNIVYFCRLYIPLLIEEAQDIFNNDSEEPRTIVEPLRNAFKELNHVYKESKYVLSFRHYDKYPQHSITESLQSSTISNNGILLALFGFASRILIDALSNDESQYVLECVAMIKEVAESLYDNYAIYKDETVLVSLLILAHLWCIIGLNLEYNFMANNPINAQLYNFSITSNLAYTVKMIDRIIEMCTDGSGKIFFDAMKRSIEARGSVSIRMQTSLSPESDIACAVQFIPIAGIDDIEKQFCVVYGDKGNINPMKNTREKSTWATPMIETTPDILNNPVYANDYIRGQYRPNGRHSITTPINNVEIESLPNNKKYKNINNKKYQRTIPNLDNRRNKKPSSDAMLPIDLIYQRHEIQFGKLLGSGGFSKVVEGKIHNEKVAIKILKGVNMKDLLRELRPLLQLKHRNLVNFRGVCFDSNFLALITELCPVGSLHNYLHSGRSIDNGRRLKFAISVTEAICYLHNCSPPVVHRDLKTANILLSNNFMVKVCDFGLTLNADSLKSKNNSGRLVGTPRYMAPELYANSVAATKDVITEKIDIWSLGCVIIEIFGGPLPFSHCKNSNEIRDELLYKCNGPKYPASLDKKILSVIHGCLQFKQSKRITAFEALDMLKQVGDDII